MKVIVIIPAYNEAKVIRNVVSDVKKHGYDVVVVDDCSLDSTYHYAEKAGAVVLRHHVNRGQGAALATGMEYALSQEADIVVTFDADGQHCAHEIQSIITPIIKGEVDVVLGSRFLGTTQDMSRSRGISLKAALFFTRLTTGLALTDVHNGFRAFSKNAALKIKIFQNRMAHASEILDQISQHNLRFIEVPVTIIYSSYSRQKGDSSLKRIITTLSQIILGKTFSK
ncbi:MAG TPA: glycosyltransferase family 2 protein [Patescibacteria group bacterium]|nr:glycosyltransferase family 2 protein [Patescibacteria group bacterium]